MMKYKRCGECKNFTAHFMTTVCCDCELMSNFERKPPMTNGDRIRAMSNEELAMQFIYFRDDWSDYETPVGFFEDDEEAYIKTVEWLKQEADDATH